MSPDGYTKILFCLAYKTLIMFIITAKSSRKINESEYEEYWEKRKSIISLMIQGFEMHNIQYIHPGKRI